MTQNIRVSPCTRFSCTVRRMYHQRVLLCRCTLCRCRSSRGVIRCRRILGRGLGRGRHALSSSSSFSSVRKARHIAVLMPNVHKWWVAPVSTAIRQMAAMTPQVIVQAFIVLCCSYDYYLVAHFYGVRYAELSAHDLGHLAGALANVADVYLGRVGLPFFSFSHCGERLHDADSALVLSFF